VAKLDAKQKKAVVLLSGGMDSATVMAMAIASNYAVHALSISYGQRHGAELAAAQKLALKHGAVEHRVVNLDLRAIGGSALTADIAVPESPTGGIPITYVPARNTIMLAIALGYAEVIGAADIFVGVNAVDYSGYPDCRPDFIAAFERVAQLATRAAVEGAEFRIHAPIIAMSKADIVREGVLLGVDFAQTVSCYQADTNGLACRKCDACRLRAQGFVDAGVVDVTRYK
jgi:7-cyano-7-deazaguanine synthase